MNSRLEEMRRASQESAEKALDTSRATLVFDSNWKALIGLNKQTSDTQVEILETMLELLTKEDTQYLLRKIEQSSERSLSEQRKALRDMVSQAGKLNEQFSTQTKQLEEFRHKLKVRLWAVIIASQVSLALLLSALGLWLR